MDTSCSPPPMQSGPPLDVLVLELATETADKFPLLPVERPSRPSLWWRVWSGIGSVCEWLFGAATLLIGLSALAAVPLVQFLSLGYLLEAAGRVARSGRLRDGFIGVRIAARIGGIVLCSWLFLLPVRTASTLARAAQIVEPGGRTAAGWRFGLVLLMTLTVLHLVAACARGGKVRYFLWPFNPIWLVRRLRRGGYYAEARDAVWDYVVALRLPHYFWLGVRGFAGAFVWLAVPISLLALGRIPNGFGFLIGFTGAFLLAVALLYVPYLQVHFAVENRFAALFEVRAVRAAFKRAPWAFAISFLITLLFALPLYLLKIEMIPREAAWLPSLVFMVFIFPARLLTGWAVGRSRRRPTPRHWFWRWTGWVWMPPLAAFYVLIVFFTQYTSWDGIWSLYEQHAFLLPVPFVGM